MNGMTINDWVKEQVKLDVELIERTDILAEIVTKQQKQIKKLKRNNLFFGLLTSSVLYLLIVATNDSTKKIDSLTEEIEELKKVGE